MNLNIFFMESLILQKHRRMSVENTTVACAGGLCDSPIIKRTEDNPLTKCGASSIWYVHVSEMI